MALAFVGEGGSGGSKEESPTPLPPDCFHDADEWQNLKAVLSCAAGQHQLVGSCLGHCGSRLPGRGDPVCGEIVRVYRVPRAFQE